MKTSIIIPVYNEEHTIREVLERVQQLDIPKEIIVVDDGSTNGTGRIIDELRDRGLAVVYHCERNRGKGLAIRLGLRYATGDVVIIQDADLELDPSEIPRVVRPILDGRAQVVFGSRFRRGTPQMAFLRRLANRILSTVTNLLYHTHITDMETGYKAFQREVIQSLHLESHGFEIEPELTAKVLNRGLEIYEVPVSYHPRTVYQGKKMRWTDGLVAIYCLIKYRLRRLH